MEPATPENDNDTGHSETILPNMLIQADSIVTIRREQTTVFITATIGTELQIRDTIDIKDGNAAVFCGNEALWSETPHELKNPRDGVPCLEGRPPRPVPDVSGLRGDIEEVEEFDLIDIPYILSPRSGFVSTKRPTLRWHVIPDVETYTVTLWSDDGKERPPIIATGGELAYPEEWPPIEGNGAVYELIVIGGEQRSDIENSDRFSLLDSSDVQELQEKADLLHELPLPNPALNILLAKLYLHDEYNLRSEAIDIILMTPQSEEFVAIQQLLGETYTHMGLLIEAEDSFMRVIQLAEVQKFAEFTATGEDWLGVVYCLLEKPTLAESHWEKALEAYELLEMDSSIETVSQKLDEVNSLCQLEE